MLRLINSSNGGPSAGSARLLPVRILPTRQARTRCGDSCSGHERRQRSRLAQGQDELLSVVVAGAAAGFSVVVDVLVAAAGLASEPFEPEPPAFSYP